MRIPRQGLFILCTVLCLCFAVPVYASEGTLALDAEAGANGSVSAELSLSGLDALSGAQFTIAYDSSKLALSKVTEGELPGQGNYVINESTPGLVHVLWFSSTGGAREIEGDGTKLLSLSFTAKESGDAEIALREDGDATLLLIGEDSQAVSLRTDQASDKVQVTAASAAAQEGDSSFVSTPEYVPPLYYMPTASPLPQSSAVPLPTPQEALIQPASVQESAKPAGPQATPAAAANTNPAPTAEATQGKNPTPLLTQVPYDAPVLAASETAHGQEIKTPPELEVLHDDAPEESAFPLWLLILFLLFAAGAFFAWFFFIKRKDYEE